MTDMTPQEAYEFVLNDCHSAVEGCPRDGDPPKYREQMRTALAVLRAHHAYFSRFKPGDEVWVRDVAPFQDGKPLRGMVARGEVVCVSFDVSTHITGSYDEEELAGFDADERDCFPTRAEAEAECARRDRDA